MFGYRTYVLKEYIFTLFLRLFMWLFIPSIFSLIVYQICIYFNARDVPTWATTFVIAILSLIANINIIMDNREMRQAIDLDLMDKKTWKEATYKSSFDKIIK